MSNSLLRWFNLWPWMARLYVAGVLLSILTPIQQRAVLGEPEYVATTQPMVCVHTDLKDEVDEWKIQLSLRYAREMGAPVIVEFFPWAYLEPDEDRYQWYQADRIVQQARNQGLRIIARMGLVPGWARPRETTLNYLAPEAFPDFAEFVAVFADRYAGSIDHLILWNEPNLAFEWGYQPVDPVMYVDLLREVYPAAKAANPDVTILAGALAPTLEPPGSPHGLDDRVYLEAMYDAGAAPYFDALAVHSYGLTEPHDAEPGPDQLNFRRVELLRAIMEHNGDGHKRVTITESGWNDDPRWTKAVRPSQRIGYTLGAFHWAQENYPWLENLCVWVLRYPRPTGRYPDSFTLITPEFQLKPIYYAMQAYARGWETSEDLWLPAPDE
jgi:hypothetical protein